MLIGLTGGIGSGKSAAARMFAAHGICIADTDQAAREVVAPGQPALAAIARHFGRQVLTADGSLDRKAMRQLVFANPAERQWLEQLTHPLIRQLVEQQLAAASSPYAILVSPLLIESGQHQRVQRVLVIDLAPELQIERTLARDSVSAEQVTAIMQAQLGREQRLACADDIIDNSGSMTELEQQVARLHDKYLSLARSQR